jgi:cytochrome c biogenesis protein CcdA
VAMITMQLTGFSTKYGKLSKIIGGILLLIMGILLILKPDWLMFNF